MKKASVLLILAFIFILSFNQAQAAVTYNVQNGDTLWEISQNFGVPVEFIITQNGIGNPGNIYVGQKLVIKAENNRITIDIGENEQGTANYYTVRPGDTLWRVAQKYNTTVQKIIEYNNIQYPYHIYIGQRLLVSYNQQNNSNYIYYTIKRGDILWNIAQKYNTTVKRLVELNNIRNAYDLYVGRKILVPRRDTTPTYEDDTDQDYGNNISTYVPYYFYKIQVGDKIWTIADKFGVRVSTLINYNNISDVNTIQAGQVLIIPLNSSSKMSYLKKTSQKLNNYYRVRSNETLADIAGYFMIPEEGLRAINEMTQDEAVYTGQKLLMPVNPALFVKHELYRVKPGGEYIFDIAFNKGVSIKSILRANYMKNQNIKFNGGTIILIALDENSKATWIEYENGKPVNSWFN